jgi:hypothetical protein
VVEPASAAGPPRSSRPSGVLLLLRDLRHLRLGEEQEAGDQGGVEQRVSGHLGRVDDAGLDHVGNVALLCVVADVAAFGADLARDHRHLVETTSRRSMRCPASRMRLPSESSARRSS